MTDTPILEAMRNCRWRKKWICEIGSADVSQVAGFASGRLGIRADLLRLGKTHEGSRIAIKRYQKIFMDIGGWGFGFRDPL